MGWLNLQEKQSHLLDNIQVGYILSIGFKVLMKSFITKCIWVLFLIAFFQSYLQESKVNASSTSTSLCLAESKSKGPTPGRDDVDEFHSFVAAKKYYLWSPAGLDELQSYRFKIPKDKYFVKLSNEKELPVSVILEVFNVYDIVNKKNFYYLLFHVTAEFGESYATREDISYNGYGMEVELSAYPTADDVEFEALKVAPSTTETSSNLSTGIDFTVGTVVGYKGGADLEARPGITVKTTNSYSIPDVTVVNTTSTYRYLKWMFKLKEPDHDFWGLLTREGALVGRSTFDGYAAAIIAFHDTGFPPQLLFKGRVKLGSMESDFFRVLTKEIDLNLPEAKVQLPFLTIGEAKYAEENNMKTK